MDIFKQATSLKVKEELQKAGFECEVSYAEDRDVVEGGGTRYGIDSHQSLIPP